jgi:16S rRNA (uracil1498-N3)-methyltransferase
VHEIQVVDGTVLITGSEAKHIARVLRMTRGDRLILTDGKDQRLQVVIESARPQEVLVVVERSLPHPPPPPVEIIICQALLKSRPMDYLIQKTTELGVASIQPFTSERTVVKLKENRPSNKLRHWREIARNGAKQCDRGAPAEIQAVTSVEEILARHNDKNALKVVLWEHEKSEDLKTLLGTASTHSSVVGVVGPEGGFAAQEIALAQEAGFVPVSLGSRILRAETAAITLVAIVQYEWGDLSLNALGL